MRYPPMRYSAVPPIVMVFILAACGGDGPTAPAPTGGAVSLEIAPSALLLPATGAQQQLTAYAVDAHGTRTAVPASFSTSNAAVVAVTATGLATGGSSIGSAQIVATSGGLTSAPLLALRATPAAGALLVADSQVVGTIEPVDPSAAYQPGWHYRVRLRGVTPTSGQVLLASGGAPVGGRVVSLASAGSDFDVVLELIPISEMFSQLTFSEHLPLANASLVVPASLRTGFRRGQTPTGGLRLEARKKLQYQASAARPSFSGAQVTQEFDLGPFECKAEVPPGFVFPITLDVFSFDLDPELFLDVAFSDGVLERAVVTGSIAPRLTASPRLTAALEAKTECKIQLATLHLPIGGPLSLVIGGQVPLGVGFEIGAKATLGQLGFDALLQTDLTAEFGIDCASGCQVVTTLSSNGAGSYFKPVLPNLDTDARLELGLSGFGWAELAIGNSFLEALQFKLVELKAGLEQKLELATRQAQATDAAYASSVSLKPVLEAKAAANLVAIGNLLSINLATLTYSPMLPVLAQSPHGTFTITPANVAPGDGTALGDMATFTVDLSDVTYLGAYAVEGIEIRWLKTDGTTTTLEPGRPGCTDLEAAQGQVSFSCQTDFLEEHAGKQTFYAFAKTRIFGVPLPVPLEIALDAKASVTVEGSNGGGMTLVEASGGVSASTEIFPVTSCDSTDSFQDVGSNVLPTRTLTARCSSTHTFPEGASSASTSGNLTYTITSSGSTTHGITASGSGTSTAQVPTNLPSATATARLFQHLEFVFDLADTTLITVSATGSGFDPNGLNPNAHVDLTGGPEQDVIADLDSGGVAALSLAPGRYYLAASWQCNSLTTNNVPGIPASVTFGLTLTANP